MLFTSRSIVLFLTSSFLFIACQTQTEPVKANPRFYDLPSKYVANTLQYEDTTLPYYKHLIERLDSFYRAQVRAGFNGSVLLGHKGKIFYERYYGFARKQGAQPLEPNSSSQLASISKTFTGAAVLYLYQNKYLDINETVKHYLPNFPYSTITIKMLLCHCSGLPDYQKWGRPYIMNDQPISNDKVLEIFEKYKPNLESKPNSRFKYCNSNYALLASIVEKVTDMKFAAFMNKYIFQPLGMSNTFIHHSPDPLPSNATFNYKYNWIKWENNFADGVVGDKGVYSTVRDMYRWDQSFYQNKLLNNETIELAYGPCSFEKKGTKNYGLGWRMLCFPNGNKIIYHNGWWHGCNTVFYRFIQEDLTFIVLGNRYNNNIYRQAKELYSIVKNVPVADGFDGEE